MRYIYKIITIAILVIGGPAMGKSIRSDIVEPTKRFGLMKVKGVPHEINYQGWLGTADDTIGVTGTFTMRFRLYTQETGGTAVWEETHSNVNVSNGIFNVILGSVNPIPAEIFTGDALWLEVQVGNEVLAPRKKLISVGYAIQAENAEYARYADTAEFAVNVGINYVDSAGVAANAWRWNNNTWGVEYPKANVADTATYADTAGYAHVSAPDNDWVLETSPANYLRTYGDYGIARKGAVLYGSDAYTHVNLGVACTTGTAGSNWGYCTVGGGVYNSASCLYATVGGGEYNNASGSDATVGGGCSNTASGPDATVGGGYDNTASGACATVGGGHDNTASGFAATVIGGCGNTAAGDYSIAGGDHSVVPSDYSNSVAFNGQTATASGQLRCGTISKTGGGFTIDHPLDPDNKILNHYFVESPEMVLIYRGVAVIGANGRATVHLPEYFDALNRNPMIQLTGVGTSDVYVVEEVHNNQFVIGGKPGTKVYWMVTGERKDQSAEIIRAMMPVEQPKTGALVGRSLDDEFLATTMKQLEEMGISYKFHFRTDAGRRRYELMKQPPQKPVEEIREPHR